MEEKRYYKHHVRNLVEKSCNEELREILAGIIEYFFE
jgi:hypothetical protein